MTSRAATVASWWPWLALPVATASLVSLAVAFDLLDEREAYLEGESWFLAVAALGFAVVAAAIWSTRPHPVGLLRLGALFTSVALGSGLALAAYAWARSDLDGAVAAGWVSGWVWALGAPPLMGLGLLLYPDGRLPGRRWWPAAACGGVGVAGLVLHGAFAPGPLANLAGIDNPVGVGPEALWDVVAGIAFPILLVGTVAGLAGLAVRFARATPQSDVRGQIGAVLLAGGVMVLAAVLPADAEPAQTSLSLLAGVAVPATIGHAVLRHRLLDQRSEVAGLQRRVSSLTESRRELVTDREDERAALRRELHDGLGPSLAAIGLGLRQLEHDPDPVAVHALADEVQRAVGEVRRITSGLGPAALDDLGLSTALKESLGTLDRFGPRMEVRVEVLPTLPRAVEVATYRIVMEAATNALRHAAASRVRVDVRHDDGVTVRVEDDGRGLRPDAAAGVGLRAMRARAEELGGWIEVRGGAGGTTVEAWLPTGGS